MAFNINPRFNSTREIMDNIYTAMGKEQDALLAAQLGDLIKDGILVIVRTQPVLVQEDGKIKVSQSIQLMSKEHEYIQKLKDEVKLLRDKNAILEKVIDDVQRTLTRGRPWKD